MMGRYENGRLGVVPVDSGQHPSTKQTGGHLNTRAANERRIEKVTYT